MNRLLLLILFFCFGIIESQLNAQIGVLPDIPKKEEPKVVKEKLMEKEVILPYDSLDRFNNKNYKNQIGQTLYLTSWDRKYFSEMFFEDFAGTRKYQYVERNGVIFHPDYDRLVGKFYSVNRLFDEDELGKGNACFELIMQEEPHDTIYYRFRVVGPRDDGGFVNVGYAIKQKSIYKDTQLVFNDPWLDRLENQETGERMKGVPLGTRLVCTDVLLSKERGIVYLLCNPDYPPLFTTAIWGLDTLESYLADQKKKADEEKAQKQKEAEIIRKYGKAALEQMKSGIVKIGWTTDMCKEAWGKPTDINVTTTQYGTTTQWVYGSGRYLYFENGKLVSIQR